MANYFTDRVVQHPGRVVMTPTGNLNEYDLSRSEGTIATPGTPFSAAAFNEIANIIHAYGTCTTSAGTATKVVSCPGFTLQTGAKITVLFSNENSVSETTYLNVNGTGAREIRSVTGASMTTPPTWKANRVVTFVYSGSYWLIAGQDTTELADKMTTKNLTPSITVSTGTLLGTTLRRNGNVMVLTVTVRNTASVAVGSFFFQGTLTGVPLPPSFVTNATYYGARTIVGSLSYTGTISIRNTYSQAVTMGSSDNMVMSFTWICDD